MAALASFPRYFATAKAGRVHIVAQTLTNALIDTDTVLNNDDETAQIVKVTIQVSAETADLALAFDYQAEFWRDSTGAEVFETFESDNEVINRRTGKFSDLDEVESLENAAGPFGVLYLGMESAVWHIAQQAKEAAFALLASHDKEAA